MKCNWFCDISTNQRAAQQTNGVYFEEVMWSVERRQECPLSRMMFKISIRDMAH